MNTEVCRILFAKCHPDAKIPERVPGSVGLDIYASFDEDYIMIPPLSTKLIPTGLRSVIDPNYFMLIEERGSTGSKGIKRSAGIVDADYRGQIFVALTNANSVPVYISKRPDIKVEESAIIYPYTKAIAQGIILPVVNISIQNVFDEEIDKWPTSRGEGALGSSGK